MSDKTYNGWTNYATWRVHLELFDCQYNAECFDLDQESYDLGIDLKNHAETVIESSSDEGIARDYALAFLSDVNWREIAEHMIEEYADEEET